jgi:hypothetical protein
VKRILGLVLFLCVFLFPVNVHGEANTLNEKNLVKGNIPKSGLKQGISLDTTANYPLVNDGQYLTYLQDNYGTYHFIYFNSVANYSTSKMDVQILDSTLYSYYKDSIVTIEFYKSNGTSTQFVGATEFDTYGIADSYMHSYVLKSDFSSQPYIYIKVGISEYSTDQYYSNYVQFKVVNPFYTKPPADKTPPAKPTVNSVSDASSTVSGKAESGATVYVLAGSKTLGTATAKSDQLFSVPISKQKAGSKLSIYAKDKAGNKSSSVIVTVTDKTPPKKPAIHTIGDNQTVVIGTTDAKSRVTIMLGSTLVGDGFASSSGQFIIKLKAVQKAGATVTVYAYDSAKNKSSTSVKIVDKTPPVVPTVNKITYSTTSVTGKAEVGSTIYIFNNGTYIGRGTTLSNGSFKITIKKQNKGSILSICTLDKAENQSKMISVKVY